MLKKFSKKTLLIAGAIFVVVVRLPANADSR